MPDQRGIAQALMQFFNQAGQNQPPPSYGGVPPQMPNVGWGQNPLGQFMWPSNSIAANQTPPFFTNPADQQAIQQQGLIPAMGTRAGEQIMSSGRALGNAFMQDPVVQGLGGAFKYLFTGEGTPEAQAAAAGGQAGTQPPFYTDPGVRGRTEVSAAGYGGAGGGGGMGGSYQGVPLPQAPSLAAPDVDINKIFDPIIASLPDPEKIKGPSKMAGLAEVLGGAAGGAMRGMTRLGGGSTGATIAGAGWGASAALGSLRHEEQALEAEYRRSLQDVQRARAGVMGQKAGAQVNLAEQVANAKNAEAQLKFNRDVQASKMSHQTIQPLGGGYYMVDQFDPETGKGSRQQFDAVGPTQRALEFGLKMAMYKARTAGKSPKNKVILDKHEYDVDSIIGYASEQYKTPIQAETLQIALMARNLPSAWAAYGKQVEERMKNGEFPSGFELSYNEEPERLTMMTMIQDMLVHPEKRVELGNLVFGGKVPQALAAEE